MKDILLLALTVPGEEHTVDADALADDLVTIINRHRSEGRGLAMFVHCVRLLRLAHESAREEGA